MHKWNVLKKTAPVFLSLAVAATSMPTTILAADAFGDGTVVETEDVSAEEVSEDDLAEEASTDASVEEVPEDTADVPEEVTEDAASEEDSLFTSEEEAVETDTLEAEDVADGGEVQVAGYTYPWTKVADGSAAPTGYKKIGDSNVYYKVDESNSLFSWRVYYGKTTLSYTDFYKTGSFDSTVYDSVTSATTKKNQLFENADATTPDENGYKINGVKNVSVKVGDKDYVEAKILEAAGELPSDGVYAKAAGIVLNESPSDEVTQYKALSSSGTYGKWQIADAAQTKVTDATATLKTSSRRGDYVIKVNETSTKYLRNSKEGDFAVAANVQGVILKTKSGKTVGLRHLQEIWVKPYELAFSKDAGLQGETITEITYIIPEGRYVYSFADGIYVKKQATDAMKEAVTATFENKNTVKVTGLDKFKNPMVSVYYVTGSGKNSKTTYMAEETAVTVGEDGSAAVTFADEKVAQAGKEYTVKVTSDDYADLTTTAIRSESDEWSYMYVGLTWSEYWANEGVYMAGSTEANAETDDRDEHDKGAFDTVTRATVNHGFHRGSFQCTTVIYTTDGKIFPVQSWSADGGTMILTDGSSVGYKKGVITDAEGSHILKEYDVYGLKYVPVKVNNEDLEAFKAAYGSKIVENGAAMSGGYGELKLSAYTATATVTENTNGLKTAVLQENGSFAFSARNNAGTESGLQDQALKTADGLIVTVKPADGSYGEFLRVDLTGNYGDLGAHMQAARWDYYGTGDTVLASYGTKFAADNWMHKTNGIQLGLTNSLRCQLPEGTDGTGKWVITVYALGYADTQVTVNAAEENIVKAMANATEEEIASATSAVNTAEALKESDYTAESWAAMQTELGELKDALKKAKPKAPVLNEGIQHLNAAIAALVKAPVPTAVPVQPTATPTPSAEPTVTPTPSVEPTKAPAPEVKPSLTVKKAVLNLKAKKSATIVPVLTGISGNVTYKSSNKKVAAVNSKGKVTAKKTGKAVITVKCGSYKTKVAVYVNEKLKLKKSSAVIEVKGKTSIKATTNITGKITYTSSNKKIATVTSKGVVKGIKKGKATITVKCNGVSKKFKVTVK